MIGNQRVFNVIVQFVPDKTTAELMGLILEQYFEIAEDGEVAMDLVLGEIKNRYPNMLILQKFAFELTAAQMKMIKDVCLGLA